MMHTSRSLKVVLRVVKRLIKSNKYTSKTAKSLKEALIKQLGTNEPRELYNLSSFYPTIQDYYYQFQQKTTKQDPLISILMPTYNTPKDYLIECIDSIIMQSYPKWELCIADDNSTDKDVVGIINEYIKKDGRIKLVKRTENGHISAATNSALEIARGSFVALMDHDDVLWPNALYEIVKVIRSNKNVDFIYSDEDKIDGSGKIHSYPFLKPDFSPEFLESCNYITHFSCIRTTIIKKVGGFRKGYEGAQDWDLFLRISEITQNIIHTPKILYSWRIHEASTASNTDAKPYVYEAQKKLLIDHVDRTGMTGRVETGIIKQHRTIKYDIKKGNSLTVVIFISELAKTRRLVESLSEHSPGFKYALLYCHNIEISQADKTELEDSLKGIARQGFIKIDLKNKYLDAAKHIKTNNVLYIEDNVTVLDDGWAKIFTSETQRPGVGLVAPVLLDKSTNNIVSSGVGLGYGLGGSIDMLGGMPFDDPHYTRGLYAKSRRNVSSVNPSVFAVNIDALNSTKKSVGEYGNNIIALSMIMSKNNYRHIYSPYVRFVCHEELPVDNAMMPKKSTVEDRFLNPNFNHANGRMEVKA